MRADRLKSLDWPFSARGYSDLPDWRGWHREHRDGIRETLRRDIHTSEYVSYLEIGAHEKCSRMKSHGLRNLQEVEDWVHQHIPRLQFYHERLNETVPDGFRVNPWRNHAC